MALVFPLSYAEFLEALPISSMSFECPEVVAVSQTAGAEVLTEDVGERYWQGEVRLGKIKRAEHRRAKVLIDVVAGAGGSFFAHDITHPFPEADPTGAVIAGASPVIASLPSDAREISLSGLPAGYALRRGDFLSFSYLVSPTRYAVHSVVDVEIAANAGGSTAAFQIDPPRAPGAVIGASVSLSRASCKAVIVPDSVQPGRTDRFINEGMSFSFIQTRR